MAGILDVTTERSETEQPTYAFPLRDRHNAREVSLTVRRVGGDVVRAFRQGVEGDSGVDVQWDGLDAAGRRAPQGLYLIEAAMVAANGAVSRRVETVCLRS